MYTGRGDKGETSLFGSRRVSKDTAVVEAYGSIDELNSYLGIVISGSKDAKIKSSLVEIQKLLLVAGADAATEYHSTAKVPRITSASTRKIEKMTDEMLGELPTLRNFVIPGGSGTAARLQFARTICRRAERRLVAASKVESMNPELIPFFNRLSSFLFNLAREANKRAKHNETAWKGEDF
jgi:cob(I)alamin adenosyltransferase